MLWRGILPAAVAVFAFALGSYEAAALLAPSDPLALPLQTMERYTDVVAGAPGRRLRAGAARAGAGLAAVAVHERLRAAWGRLDP